MTNELQRTPLHAAHLEWNGRMVDFAGWSMPIAFEGVIAEHIHTRTSASLFDVSHMGRLNLSGDGAESLLNRLCTRNLTNAEVGRCYYGHICREDGGVLDDVIVSRFEDHWGVVCNGSNRAKIVSWIDRHCEGTGVTLTDETTSTAMLAIQGPKTLGWAEKIAGRDLSGLKRYRFITFEFLGMKIVVYRAGYTGEDGVEIVLPAGAVNMLLPTVLGTAKVPHQFIRPAGLGARDTLRLEAGMPLYGHELTEDWDSLTGGQGWCVDLTKEFIGGDAMRAIKARGLDRQIVGLMLEGRRIARQGYPVCAGQETVGFVTSGTLSPTLGSSIAMAMIGVDHHAPGSELEVDVKGKRVAAKVVALPFYRKPKG